LRSSPGAIAVISVCGGTVLTNCNGSNPSLGVIALNGGASGVGEAMRLSSGALVTLPSGGTFSHIRTRVRCTGGGSTATATITIGGIATPAPDGIDRVNGGAGTDAFFVGTMLNGADRINVGSAAIGYRRQPIDADRNHANQCRNLAALPGGAYDIVLNDGVSAIPIG
jgi:hypothetical protein